MTILVQITKTSYLETKKMLTAHLTKKNLNQQGFTLIELLVVIGILAILMGIVLIAINPARQFAQANNTTRSNSVTQILNAVGQYAADNKGKLPAGIPVGAAAAAVDISDTGANLCTLLVPTYLPALPQDPGSNNGTQITAPCPATYDTKFKVVQDANGRVTISAPDAEIGAIITVTR